MNKTEQKETLAKIFDGARKYVVDKSDVNFQQGICYSLHSQADPDGPNFDFICRIVNFSNSEIRALLQSYTVDPLLYKGPLTYQGYSYLHHAVADQVLGLHQCEDMDKANAWINENWIAIVEFRLAILDVLEEICNCIDWDFSDTPLDI